MLRMPVKTARTSSKSSLRTYNQKRKFRQTPEPTGAPARRSTRSEPIFVVQKHDATRLHWDLRLEVDGVLKSWAVTNEPTLDPSIKRLAVQTEDHPMTYADFQGDIPEGNYGAGHVEIWDRGTFEPLDVDRKHLPEKLDQGRLKFELHGRRLNGAFALVRMNRGNGEKKNWLLIKSQDAAARTDPAARQTAKKKSRSRKAKVSASSARPHAIPFSNTDKVMFPEHDITKGDVIEFYEAIADRLLPWLKDRPLTLERLPDGVGQGKPHFWQKNTPAYYPRWIPRAKLPTEEGKDVNYVLANDRHALMYLVNQGAITLHTWLSRAQSPDTPDFVLFDLDPDPAPFRDAVQIARQLREILQSRSAPSAAKTSGASGLHILTQWDRRDGDYDAARKWALEIAEEVCAKLPKIATVERSKAKRRGRVYVDVMQNARGHHVVPPYVLRATSDAGVSTPLDWNELTDDLDPRALTLRTIFRRLKQRKRDPMKLIL